MLAERGASVLVVEDNRADAELVLDGFAAAPQPVEVKLAGDGHAALEFLRTPGPDGRRPEVDLILLDLNLPRTGGLDTLAALKSDDELRAIPVLVVTTSKSEREIRSSYELGAAAVLNKPMRLAEHRRMMSTLLEFWLDLVRLPRDAR